MTGEDIAALDLSGTELVVLSACDTGLGDIRVQEGPQGPAHAFTLAGARWILVTLWRVHDRIGREFTTAFHTDYATHGDPRRALRHARSRTAAEHPDPVHWAAYVLYGIPASAEPDGLRRESGPSGSSRYAKTPSDGKPSRTNHDTVPNPAESRRPLRSPDGGMPTRTC
ncbi:CHAT domain-containing protein [Embleya hyalina]|uniref:CHAT domain-containing protein n=1 Tax=Embleya hyalina TaxID=516124 RepID=A0A401Z631_9ACTN|nr:CHAT domain-containing protein [Embleya hyalina]